MDTDGGSLTSNTCIMLLRCPTSNLLNWFLDTIVPLAYPLCASSIDSAADQPGWQQTNATIHLWVCYLFQHCKWLCQWKGTHTPTLWERVAHCSYHDHWSLHFCGRICYQQVGGLYFAKPT